MQDNKNNAAVLIRIAFVLGNLTTHNGRARKELCVIPDCFSQVINLAEYYLSGQVIEATKGQKTKKYEDFNQGSIEDAVTKIIKLLANLSTEEAYALKQFQTS